MNDIVLEILRWLIGLIAIAWGGLFLVFSMGAVCAAYSKFLTWAARCAEARRTWNNGRH